MFDDDGLGNDYRDLGDDEAGDWADNDSSSE